MRFRSLGIDKYGVFAERTVELPDSPGLVVLYGPNEAGKSTCLAAIADFLFGIPQQSPHGQVFGYEQMRLSATLALADGGTLCLRRRKGRQNQTLSDAAGARVEEVVLSRWLGGTGRERFQTLFGIDHAQLRSGGERLLAADGDIGRLIVEAGGGLRSLVAAMEALKADADRHFSPRRSGERLFYRALDVWEAADRQVKEGTLTRDVFDKALARQGEAQQAREDLRAEHREAGQRASRLQRLVRVAPVLRRLEACERDLAGFDDLSRLPDTFSGFAGAAAVSLEAAERAVREAGEREAALLAKLQALPLPTALLDAEAAIRDAHEAATIVAKARGDRANRQQELAGSEATLNRLRAAVGLAADADLEALLPDPAAIERVQRLAERGTDLRARMDAAADQRAGDVAALDQLRVIQAERERLRLSVPLGHVAADVGPLPAAQAALDAKTAQATRARRVLAERVAGLGFADLAALAAWRCPDPQVVQAEIDVRVALDVEAARLADKIARAGEQRDAASAEIARLTGGDVVPTAEDLREARAGRDEVWTAIRERYLEPAAAVRSPADRRADVADFEQARTAADDIADRRTAAAERGAAIELATRQQAEAAAAAVAAEKERADLDGRSRARERAWRAAWPEAAARCEDSGALKRLVEERRAVLDTAAALADADAETARLAAEAVPLVAALADVEARLGLAVEREAALASRVAAAVTAIRAHEDAYADYRRDAATRGDLERRLTALDASLREQRDAHAAWAAEWAEAVAALALEPAASPERGTAVATLWAAARGEIGTLRLTRTRLRKMDADEAALTARIAALAPCVDVALPSDPVAAAEMLHDRCKAARRRAVERDSLDRQRPELASDREAKQRACDEARIALAALCAQAGCDPEALLRVAERCESRTRLITERRALLQEIATAGDGFAAAELSTQVGDRDQDALEAELVEANGEVARLRDESDQALLRFQDAQQALAAFAATEGLNAAVAARESATAELHAAARGWLERTLAHDLLQEAIDRVRAEQQHPLVVRATEMFARLTRGAFAGIEADVDGDGRPIVVGRRASGERVHAARMSDGTRDQLFLAFRLAAVERYCRAAEPLPFVADDLLVHFDDARSAATLDLLADVARVTQVLLFTHHRRIVEAAQPLVAAGRAAVLEMACD